MHRPLKMLLIAPAYKLAGEQVRVTIDFDATKDGLLAVMAMPANVNVLHLDHRDLPQRLSECFDRLRLWMLMHGSSPSPWCGPGMQFLRQLKGGDHRQKRNP